MKRIWPLLTAALILCPMGAEAHAFAPQDAAQILKAAFQQQHGRRGGQDDRQNFNGGDNRGNNDRGRGDRGDDINRAIAIASSRGHVLDAGPQGGSIYWVRVATDHGRVDLLVDVDSGRIIGER
jgi:hypothetical protein